MYFNVLIFEILFKLYAQNTRGETILLSESYSLVPVNGPDLTELFVRKTVRINVCADLMLFVVPILNVILIRFGKKNRAYNNL